MKNNFNLVFIILLFVVIACNCPKPEDQKINTNTSNNTSQQTPAPTPKPTFAELKSKSEKLLNIDTKAEFKKEDLNQFDEVMTPLKEIGKDSKDYKSAQNLIKKLIDKSSVIAAEIILLGEKPKNSEWDGNVAPAQDYLKQTLNDYDSSEYLGWSPVAKVYIKKEPYWATRVKLRAKNAFGAYIVKDVYFLIRNNKVVLAEGL